MRFYNQQHQFYCGVDLHARSMYLCIRDQAGAIVLHQDLVAQADNFLQCAGEMPQQRAEKYVPIQGQGQLVRGGQGEGRRAHES